MAELVLDASWDNLDQAFAALESELTSIVRGLTVEIWNGVLLRTPQYYGRMVASYTYSVGVPVFVDRSHAVEPVTEEQIESTPPKSKGHVEAIELANFYNSGAETRFKLGDMVFISNGVDHGEGSYSQAVEEGRVYLRSVNRPGAPARRTLDAIASRYANNISPKKALELKTLSIRG